MCENVRLVCGCAGICHTQPEETLLEELKDIVDTMIEYVCDEHSRWVAACEEAYGNLMYAAENHNKIAYTVRLLRPSIQGLALQGAWSLWRDRVKDLVAIEPYHPLLFEGKQSGQGMCQLWEPNDCRCNGVCDDCGKPNQGAHPFCMMWDDEMCECYGIAGLQSTCRGSWMDTGVRGRRPEPPLARRLELSEKDREARRRFG